MSELNDQFSHLTIKRQRTVTLSGEILELLRDSIKRFKQRNDYKRDTGLSTLHSIGILRVNLAADYLDEVGLTADAKRVRNTYRELVWYKWPARIKTDKSVFQNHVHIITGMAIRLENYLSGLRDELVKVTSGGEPPSDKSGPAAVDERTGNERKTADVEANAQQLSSEQQEEVLKQLEPAQRKAYISYLYSESKTEKRLEDNDAWKLLKDKGLPEDADGLGELTDYKIPAFDTWARQLRQARKPLGEQKYTPRRGRPSGSSIVKSDEIEFQHGDDS